MKIFISIDMEGISGLVDGTQTGGDSGEYNYYRKMMAGDLNAAIEAALDSGVKEIVVSDAHGGMRNLQPEDVNEAAFLIRGSPKPFNMMSGISEGFDAALYVGYHAMVGTENAILSHTISGGVVDGIYINGREIGEFGLNAALAGWYNVPSIFISGDEAVALEAKNFVPNISTAVVKWAVGRASAKCLHPKVARKVIYDGVKEALTKVNDIEPLWINAPVEVRMNWFRETMADIVSVLPYMERIDGRSTKALFDDYPTAVRGLRSAITVAGTTLR